MLPVRLAQAWALAVLALGLSGCGRCGGGTTGGAPGTAAWPAFPVTAEARAALVEAHTRRPVGAAADGGAGADAGPGPPAAGDRAEAVRTPEQVMAAAEQLGWATLPAGDARVAAWLRERLSSGERPRPAWLLFGTFHDAAGQVEAFRRLVGPGGAGPFTHVVLEQLRADGRWTGTDAGQAGDSVLLRRYLETGEGSAWDALALAHEAHDYTAWKYGYAAGVLDVVVAARAQGSRTHGCELPDELRAALGEDDASTHLRELHCALSVRDALRGTPAPRVAMLWGLAHVAPAGFQRYLPPDDVVVTVQAVGARHSADADDSQLRRRLVLYAPVLVPLGQRDAALLLPDGHLGGPLDRVRTQGALERPVVRVESTTPGAFRLGAARVEVPAAGAQLEVAPGEHTWCFEAEGGLRLVGTVTVVPRGGAELSLDPPARAARLVELGPGYR